MRNTKSRPQARSNHVSGRSGAMPGPSSRSRTLLLLTKFLERRDLVFDRRSSGQRRPLHGATGTGVAGNVRSADTVPDGRILDQLAPSSSTGCSNALCTRMIDTRRGDWRSPAEAKLLLQLPLMHPASPASSRPTATCIGCYSPFGLSPISKNGLKSALSRWQQALSPQCCRHPKRRSTSSTN